MEDGAAPRRSMSTTALRSAAADRIERRWKNVVARFRSWPRWPDGYYARRVDASCVRPSGKAVVVADLRPVSGRCRRASHNAQNAALRGRGVHGARHRCRHGLKRPQRLSRSCATGWSTRSARKSARCLFVSDSKAATNADSAAQGAGELQDIFWIAGGKAKTGGIDSLTEASFRASTQGVISDRRERRTARFAKTLDGRVPFTVNQDPASRFLSALRRRDARASGLSEAEWYFIVAQLGTPFDQYPNPEVRGKAFTDIVLGLGVLI